MDKIIKSKNTENCFESFLVSILDEEHIDINKLYQYLVKNLQEEIASWDKSKVEDKVKLYSLEEKDKERKQKEDENKKQEKFAQEQHLKELNQSLVGLLSDILGNNLKSINEAKSFINQWREKQQFPLWLLVVNSDDAKLKDSIRFIISFVDKNAIPEIELENGIKLLTDNCKSLAEIVKGCNLYNYFVEWVSVVESLTISDKEKDISDIIEFIKKKDSKLFLLDEVKFKSLLKDYEIDRLKRKEKEREKQEKLQSTNNTQTTTVKEKETNDTIAKDYINTKRETIKKKIALNSDIKKLQSLLFKIIELEQNPSKLDFIDENLK